MHFELFKNCIWVFFSKFSLISLRIKFHMEYFLNGNYYGFDNTWREKRITWNPHNNYGMILQSQNV